MRLEGLEYVLGSCLVLVEGFWDQRHHVDTPWEGPVEWEHQTMRSLCPDQHMSYK